MKNHAEVILLTYSNAFFTINIKINIRILLTVAHSRAQNKSSDIFCIAEFPVFVGESYFETETWMCRKSWQNLKPKHTLMIMCVWMNVEKRHFKKTNRQRALTSNEPSEIFNGKFLKLNLLIFFDWNKNVTLCTQCHSSYLSVPSGLEERILTWSYLWNAFKHV